MPTYKNSKIIKAKQKKQYKLKPIEEHKPSGRPTLMTPETIAKLETAFAQGFNKSHACIFAGIKMATLYHYFKEHEDFAEKCKELQERPTIKARMVINAALNENDVGTAKWLLERKLKAEFSTRQELVGEDGEAIKLDVVNIQFSKNIDDSDGEAN